MRTRRFCTSKLHQGPRWLLHTEFHVKKWGDIEGTWVAQLQSACKACQRIAARETQARRRGKECYKPRQYQKQTREEKNRRKRERYYRQKQDPKWMHARRKSQRAAYKKAQKREYVDAAPFLEWISTIEIDRDMHDYQYVYKAIRQAKNSNSRITIATMDRILVSLDRTDLLQVFTQNTTPEPVA